MLFPHYTILNCCFSQELIQNAEDANARHVKFLHDKNSYGTEHLFDEELAQFQVMTDSVNMSLEKKSH